MRVCLARSLAQVVAAPLIRQVEQEYPEVRLLLSSALSSQVRAALETRQLDLALMPNAFELPGLYCNPVYEEGFSLFGLESMFDRPGKTIAFSAIGSRPLVAPDRDHDLRRLVERTAVDLGCPLNVKYEINDPALNFALVRDGVAFAILPDSVGLELGAGAEAVGERQLLRPSLKRMQSIVRAAEDTPGSAVLAVEEALMAVLRTLVDSKVLRGSLIYKKTYAKHR